MEFNRGARCMSIRFYRARARAGLVWKPRTAGGGVLAVSAMDTPWPGIGPGWAPRAGVD
jgi:hypothetical protein